LPLQARPEGHPGDPEAGEVVERERGLRSARHVDRTGERLDQGANHLGFPRAKRIYAIGAGREVARPPVDRGGELFLRRSRSSQERVRPGVNDQVDPGRFRCGAHRGQEVGLLRDVDHGTRRRV